MPARNGQEERMTARIISGAEIAAGIREELKARVAGLIAKHGVRPGLVTILVGEDPGSVSYVTGKQKTAREIGFHSVQESLPADITEEELVKLVRQYNDDTTIHGILVQLPLPKHINENRVLYAIDPDKDVDGLHPANLGRLMIGDARFYPCTPFGVQQMLSRSGVTIEGAEVVVVGRSNLVGKPIAMMLAQKKKDERDRDDMPYPDKGRQVSHAPGGHSDRRRRRARRGDRRHGEGRGRGYRRGR